LAVGVLQFLAGTIAGFGIGSLFEPLNREISYQVNKKIPNAIPTPADIITERMRGLIIGDEEFYDKMAKYGFSKEEADKLYEGSKNLISAREAVILKWRKGFSENEKENEALYYGKMSQLGFGKEEADYLEKAMLFYPSPTDFIRFAVREVFKEDKRAKYRMEEEFPDDIVPFARQAGVDEQVLKWYWWAHWELPSPTMVMDMVNILQPDVINTKLPDGTRYGEKYRDFGINPDEIITTYDDLSEYLGMADISPFWRDRIKALTFPPITRVDLRRLYELGIIEENELKARLLELGYSKKDAERMIEFYKAYKMSHEKDLTLSQIKTAYNYHEIDKEEAISMLEGLGYDKGEAELIIAIEDAKVEQKELENEIDVIKRLYSRGLISQEEALMSFDRLNISSKYRDRLIKETMLERAKYTKQPSKTDLDKFYTEKIITKEEYIDRMKALGYRENDINLYIQLLDKNT